ncbi:MAG: hypothetical protein IJR39_08225, partial [Treponema sp.]|nr:hypothetical protein [Treponema sp.]
IIFAYADELVPAEYKSCKNYTDSLPFAFASVLSAEKSEGAIEISLDGAEFSKISSSPKSFLEYLEFSSARKS